MLTQEVAGGGDGPPLKVSETIVRNIRVLATDQRIDSKDEDGKTEVKTFSNVTLEVTPRIAEKIAVAQSIGKLSLSLRSIADNTAELERAVASGEVKVPQGTNPAEERRMLLRDRQPADRHQHHLHDRRRRLALPAPHASLPGPAAPVRGKCDGQFANALLAAAAGAWQRRASGPGRPGRPRQQCHRRSGRSSLT